MIASLTPTPVHLYTIPSQKRAAVTLCSQFKLLAQASGEEVFAGVRGKRLRKTVAHIGEESQLRGHFAGKPILIKSPPPVPTIETRSIHASLAAKPEHILQRNNAQACRRALGSAYECPVNAVVTPAHVRLGIPLFVLGCARLPPTLDGVVIVSSRIDHFPFGTMRKVHVRAFVSKSELQNGHAGNLQAVAQRVNLGRDVSQIFRKEGQSAQRFADFQEKIVTRTINPAAIHGSSVTRGNLPELIESAKMVETDVIAILRRPAQPLNPPSVSTLLHDVPAVERISPPLAGLAEEVGRHASHDFRLKIFVQAEQFTVCPDVSAVMIYKDRNIAHDANRTIGAILTKSVPLLVEGELQRAPDADVVREFFSRSR